jgi:ATP-binding cassette subfamily B protein
MRERTVFIIAHRLSTLRNVDRIIVLKDGRIVEEGTHQELFDKRGVYHNLWTLQFSA